MERTLAIIKPDAVAVGLSGQIIQRIETAGLRVVGAKMAHLTRSKAEGFYYVHRGKPFFPSLIDFMSSGPTILMVLEGKNAIKDWRNVMGATDPSKAEKGTIRRDFGSSIEKNATHGSDSPESATFEVTYFFNGSEIFEIDKKKVQASGSAKA